MIVAAAVIAVSLAGCQPKDASVPDARQSTDIQAEVTLMADSIARDLKSEGPTAWTRYFDKSPQFFMASYGALAFPNFLAAADFVQEYARSVRRIELTWTNVRVDPLTTQLAVMGADFHEVITDTAGKDTIAGGYFTAVTVKTPAGWRLRNLHWSGAAGGK
jgi:hypothetical protein